jgi:hypothetical protein
LACRQKGAFVASISGKLDPTKKRKERKKKKKANIWTMLAPQSIFQESCEAHTLKTLLSHETFLFVCLFVCLLGGCLFFIVPQSFVYGPCICGPMLPLKSREEAT